MDKEKKEKKYEEVFAELEALVKKIEDPERDLASIGDDVKKAMQILILRILWKRR